MMRTGSVRCCLASRGAEGAHGFIETLASYVYGQVFSKLFKRAVDKRSDMALNSGHELPDFSDSSGGLACMETKMPPHTTVYGGIFKTGRRGGIRTRDPLHPMQVRYQAALHAERRGL